MKISKSSQLLNLTWALDPLMNYDLILFLVPTYFLGTLSI